MNLNELIERLEEIRESDEAAGEREVLLVTQPNYPLQYTLRGIYDPLTANEREHFDHFPEECHGCGETKSSGWRTFDEDGDMVWTCDDCTEADEDGEDNPPIYMVEGGHPYGLSPYGPRAAWNGGW